MRTPSDSEFTELVEVAWPGLYRTAYLLTGDRHQAEDLLQDALARTCVRWSSIRDKGAADAYVRQAMVRQMSRQWPRRKREVPADELPEPSYDGGLDVRADHLDLWAAVRRLPPRMRAVLVLRFLEDLSVEATARELGCSAGSVKSQTHHALARLRAALPDARIPHEELS